MGDIDFGSMLEHAEQWSPLLQDVFDTDSLETIAETTAAYVTRAQFREPPRATVVIKSGSVDRRFSAQPHDIGKELRILLGLSHCNVIEVLGHTYEKPTCTVHYWMPYVPIHLSDVLSSSQFSAHAAPGATTTIPPSFFLVATKSLVYQTLGALAYIHERGIAHRDVKPRNLLLTADGCVKLVDFGVSRSPEPHQRDLWPERRGSMCFDVATGPYRAPELLFGTTDYDACAIDLWSMGAVLAEFFTPLYLRKRYDDTAEDWFEDNDEGESDDDSPPAKLPFIIPKGLSPDSGGVEWTRGSLYDASRGQIGLAWSIFKVHGTPTDNNWPTFKELPDAQKVTFMQVPPADMRKLLPNLPPVEAQPERNDCLDIVAKLLTYPPQSRLLAEDALNHPLFKRGLPLLLPQDYPVGQCNGGDWEGSDLAEILSQCLSSVG